jgi:hypothetical protein
MSYLRRSFDGRMVFVPMDSPIVARHEVPGFMRKIPFALWGNH